MVLHHAGCTSIGVLRDRERRTKTRVDVRWWMLTMVMMVAMTVLTMMTTIVAVMTSWQKGTLGFEPGTC